MVYFVSDIHLGSYIYTSPKEAEQKFVEWLRSIEKDCEALYILGDLFDFWFEWKNVVPKGFVRTIGQLTAMADKGIRITFITGNHDMWVRDYFEKECDIRVFTGPITENIFDKRFYLSHGDNTNIKGKPMLKFMNAVFRSGVIRFLFSWLIHPDISMWFGLLWSGSSRKGHMKYQKKNSDPAQFARFKERITTPLLEHFRSIKKEQNADFAIYGHIHHAIDEYHNKGVLFLGSWFDTPSYITLQNGESPVLHTL